MEQVADDRVSGHDLIIASTSSGLTRVDPVRAENLVHVIRPGDIR